MPRLRWGVSLTWEPTELTGEEAKYILGVEGMYCHINGTWGNKEVGRLKLLYEGGKPQSG